MWASILGATLASLLLQHPTPTIPPLEHHSKLSPAFQVCYPQPVQVLVIAQSSLIIVQLEWAFYPQDPFLCSHPSQLWGLQDNIHTPHLASTPSRTQPPGCLQANQSPFRAWSLRLWYNPTAREPCMSQLSPATTPWPCALFRHALPSLHFSTLCPQPQPHIYHMSRPLAHHPCHS